jgi:hypothetical protein
MGTDNAADSSEVPGEWILGRGRVFDVVVLPVVFAVLWPLLRAALRTFVFQVCVLLFGVHVRARSAHTHCTQRAANTAPRTDDGAPQPTQQRNKKTTKQPIGERVLAAVSKKTDKPVTDAALVKWNESCWKMTAYIGLVAAAAAIAIPEPWFWDQKQFWDGATVFPLNLPIKASSLLFYYVELGFYIQAVPFLMFIEVCVCASECERGWWLFFGGVVRVCARCGECRVCGCALMTAAADDLSYRRHTRTKDTRAHTRAHNTHSPTPTTKKPPPIKKTPKPNKKQKKTKRCGARTLPSRWRTTS